MKKEFLFILFLLTTQVLAQSNFVKHVVVGGDLSIHAPQDVMSVDLDQDGDVDILTTYYLSWYENDGAQNFTRHEIDASNSVTAVYAVDMDDDGDMDILTAFSEADEVALYENDGSMNFTKNVVSTNADGVHSVFAADINGDGTMDVLSASCNDDKIAWYENTCAGCWHFEEHVISDSADYAMDVFAIDVDGDGDTDVISASRNDDKIAWYESSGKLAEFTEHLVGTLDQAQTVWAADLYNDGHIEIIAGANWDHLTVFEDNDGNQNYTPLTIGSYSESVMTADVDGDGDPDIVAEQNDGLAWFETLGSGSFAEHDINTTMHDCKAVYGRDVNGDGFTDIAAVSTSDDRVAWYENDSKQNFTEHCISEMVASGAEGVFSIDLDQDGDMDILSASNMDNRVAWYENDGLEQFAMHVISDTARWARAVYAVDMDSDGDIDVLSASQNDNKIAWYENDGNQNFTEHAVTTSLQGAADVCTADFNGDGYMDVLAAGYIADEVAWYGNDGHQNFTKHHLASGDGPRSVAAGDIDGDGDKDVVLAYFNDDEIDIYKNDGAGNFSLSNILSSSIDGPLGLAIADIDGDGDMDVACAANYDANVRWFEQVMSTLWTDHEAANVGNANDVFPADYDNDGDMDIAFITNQYSYSKLGWLENDGSQSFTKITIDDDINSGASVFGADLDGDGDMDIAAAVSGDDMIAWYENAGPSALGHPNPQTVGTFALKQNYPNPFNPTTTIQFQIPSSQFVSLSIYNLQGQKVATLINGIQQAGVHMVVFKPDNLPSGVYFYRLQGKSKKQFKKMIYLR